MIYFMFKITLFIPKLIIKTWFDGIELKLLRLIKLKSFSLYHKVSLKYINPEILAANK
jgi:hypothetical protein